MYQKQNCLCRTCSKQLACNECECCNTLTSGGHAPVIGCPDYDPIEVKHAD